MAARNFLGELEHLVLAAALRLGNESYGASLIREIEERTAREVATGSVYVTLDRLEKKGMVISVLGEPDPRRGGRPKRLVEVTTDGIQALSVHRQALLQIWDGLEARLQGGE